MPSIFTTGTDTGVGKTIITGLLYNYLLGQGKSVITQKWIQCGELENPDILIHEQFNEKPVKINNEIQKARVPYSFKAPVSPHLASKLEKRPIKKEKIINSFQKLKKEYEHVLVEGAGGIAVPYSEQDLMVDIVKELDLAVIIVAANKVGCINDSLLTIEALNRRDIKCLGVIYNNLKQNENPKAIRNNPKIIEKMSGIKTLGTLDYSHNNFILISLFDNIGETIIKTLGI